MPGPFKDYYQILGVPPDAREAEIRERRDLQRLAWHPDKFAASSPDNRRRAEKEFQRIEEAASVLLDPAKRATFDADRQARRVVPPEPQLSANDLDFGTLTIGDSKSLVLRVLNLGGRARTANVYFDEPEPWVRITIDNEAPEAGFCPIAITLTAETRPDRVGAFEDCIHVDLDGVMASARLRVRVIVPRVSRGAHSAGPPTTDPAAAVPRRHLLRWLLGLLGAFVIVSLVIKPLPSFVRDQARPAVKASAPAVGFVDEMNGNTKGRAHGISFVPGINGSAARFTRAAQSRIEYPTGIPAEGTLEWWLNVADGYFYQNYSLTPHADHATLFSTDSHGGDVTWPGAGKLFLWRDGRITFDLATAAYDRGPHQRVETNTPFHFGDWFALGVSYGSEGQYIMLDGELVASEPSHGQRLGRGGTHKASADVPTLGELASAYWAEHQYGGGFEGLVDRFRASPRQRDWVLARQTTGLITTHQSATSSRNSHPNRHDVVEPDAIKERPCDQEDVARSLASSQVTGLTIRNESSETLTLHWLDYDGRRRRYGDVPPGGMIRQSTFLTHPWVLANGTGNCVRLFYAPATIVVHEADVRHSDLNAPSGGYIVFDKIRNDPRLEANHLANETTPLRDSGHGHVLVLHPLSPSTPAFIERTLTVPDTPTALVFAVRGHPNGDCLARVIVKTPGGHETVAYEQVLVGSKGWYGASVDLGRYQHTTITVRLENHATGWYFEYLGVDYFYVAAGPTPNSSRP